MSVKRLCFVCVLAVMKSYWRRLADCKTPMAMELRWRRRDVCSGAAVLRASWRERNGRRWSWRRSVVSASWHRWLACSGISFVRTENCLTQHLVTRLLPAMTRGENVKLSCTVKLCPVSLVYNFIGLHIYMYEGRSVSKFQSWVMLLILKM